MVLDAQASAAWPWRYTARMDMHLLPSALSVSLSIANADTRTMPAGLGLHPYFPHTPDARVGYRAGSRWPPTADFLAQSARAPTQHENHIPARALRAGGLTDHVGQWDGRICVELPDGTALHIQADPVFGHLVVHRPESLADLCLEPVSHVAGGFNLAARGVPDTGTHWLAPGGSLAGSMRFALQKAGARISRPIHALAMCVSRRSRFPIRPRSTSRACTSPGRCAASSRSRRSMARSAWSRVTATCRYWPS